MCLYVVAFLELGIIRVASQIDRETKDQYQVVVQAKDMIGDAGALSATAIVIINVLDVNDNAPKFPQSKHKSLFYGHYYSIFIILCNII